MKVLLALTAGVGLSFLVGLGAGVGLMSDADEDACRSQIEQAYSAYQDHQRALGRGLLLDAVLGECISEVKGAPTS